MFKTLILFLLFIFTYLNAQMITRQQVVMGTFVSISVDKEYKSYIKPSFDLLKTIESSISSFNHNSPIYKLNRDKNASLDLYSYRALKLSLEYYKDTDGYFDIAIGCITKDLYRFGMKERLVSQKELKQSSTDIAGVLVNKKEANITNNIKIDLGGMGKGFGVDNVKKFLQNHGVKKAVIALSGDIRCMGSCKIAIYNPFQINHPLATFVMKNSGVSTSGNYNHYVKDTTHNHLINPKTKESQREFISVTLISSKLSSAMLDAYATASSVMPLDKTYKFLDSKQLSYIILQKDKKLVISKNISHNIYNLKFK